MFAVATSGSFISVDVGHTSDPTFADVDDDGDLDLIIGGQDGSLNFYEFNTAALLNVDNLSDAINTPENNGTLNLGTITISDVDNGNNLTVTTFSTIYGAVALNPVDGTSPVTDGQYTVLLSTNITFNSLTSDASHELTLTTADGTSLILTLNVLIGFSLNLSASTLTYSDTQSTDNFSAKNGTSNPTSQAVEPVSYGIVNDSNMVVTSLTGLYGTLMINASTGAYSYEPDDEAINALSANTTETFTIEAVDNRSMRATQTLTIMLTGVNDEATISTNINEAVNTVANETDVDLGTITISDVDSARNLTNLIFSTDYGMVMFVAVSATPEIDGEYTLSLASNQIFDDLTVITSENITLTTAGGTSLMLTLNFRVAYTVGLDGTFSYSDTASEDDFSAQTGTATVEGNTGSVSYGIVNVSNAVVTTLEGTYGTLVINVITGVYSYEPDDEAINGLLSNTSETFTISALDGGIQATEELTIMLTGVNDEATLSTNLNVAINTPSDDGDINLGDVTISDVDSARNLTVFSLSTAYGMVTFTPVNPTTVATDGEYTLSLASNTVFDALVTIEEEIITLTTEDGTDLELTLTFRGTYSLTLIYSNV